MKKKNIIAILVGAVVIFAGVLVVTSIPAVVQASGEVYNTNFESGIDTVWSSSNSASNSNVGKYHGNFSTTGNTTLTLSGLPPHTQLSLEFDLYLFYTWDGENITWGKDYFSLSGDVNGSWTFTNHQPEGQSYPGTPDEIYGFDIWNPNSVWVYRGLDPTGSGDEFLVNHSGDIFSVTFGGPTTQSDEWWGIDNVRVSILTLEPANVSPIADANGPYVGNEGSPITFNASGSYDPDGTIVLYEWDLDGDGQYDDVTGVNPIYTWGDDYSETIGLKVTDNDGLANTDSTTLTILNVSPTANAGPDQTVTAGDTFSFTGSMSDPGWLDTHTYQWDFDASDGIQVDATGQIPTHVYYDAGDYTVTLTVTDDDGGVGTDTLEVVVKPIPATIDCDPNTLNLKSKGQWITCYIELPAGYDVWQINGSTILLNGMIPAYLGKEGWAKAESDQSNIMDNDGDSVLERMVKFDRAAVQAILIPGEAVLTLAGKVGLADFEGSDTIRVIK